MKKIAILIFLIFTYTTIYSQDKVEWIKGVCKNMPVVFLDISDNENLLLQKSRINRAKPQTEQNRKMVLHGNISYLFNYRSFLDTPFQQQDLMQHVVQTRFDFVINKSFPVSIFLTNRSSNSNYFANVFDVSFQFKQQSFLESEKGKIKSKIDEVQKTDLLKQWDFNNAIEVLALDSFLLKLEAEKTI